MSQNNNAVTPGNLPVFFCESCHQVIDDLEQVIIEREYGFEGEAWGSYFVQSPLDIAISACCRAPILDGYGETMDYQILKDEL
jgi:hypothetical protein